MIGKDCCRIGQDPRAGARKADISFAKSAAMENQAWP